MNYKLNVKVIEPSIGEYQDYEMNALLHRMGRKLGEYKPANDNKGE